MARESERDVREEIRIALFWRALIGDYEYIKFNPDDLLRWYDALELRGPEEIRIVIDERYSTRPVNAVLGIVTAAPHPPTWLVRDWLSVHEQKVRTGGYWLGAAAFVAMSFMVGPMLYGCTQLKPMNPYVMNPPDSGPQQYTNTPPVGSAFYSNPTSPPVAFAPTQTGAQSTGIAGAAMGVTSAGGATGPANVGASAGASSSSGTGQP
jgi:hypothetical protein